jgi:hypothetical protein
MKVFFAVPAYRGIVCDEMVDSLGETMQLLKDEHNIHSTLNVLTGCCYIQIARNKLVKSFLESDCDVIMFLDDDISWNAEDAVRVIKHESDIVAGVYRIKADYEEYPAMFCCDENGQATFVNGCLEATRVPTGFLRIRRNVFEDIALLNPELEYLDFPRGIEGGLPEKYFDFFPQGVYDKVWTGEDYAFCKLWCDIGGKIWVIPDIEFNHHDGDKIYSGSVLKHFRRLENGES